MAYKNKKSGGAEAEALHLPVAASFSGRYHTCPDAARFRTTGEPVRSQHLWVVIAAWFGIACVIMMVVITQITGPWIRRTGAKTIGDFLNKVFSKVPGTMISCVNAALSIAMKCCLEVETIASHFPS